jgi:hypothetical protein
MPKPIIRTPCPTPGCRGRVVPGQSPVCYICRERVRLALRPSPVPTDPQTLIGEAKRIRGEYLSHAACVSKCASCHAPMSCEPWAGCLNPDAHTRFRRGEPYRDAERGWTRQERANDSLRAFARGGFKPICTVCGCDLPDTLEVRPVCGPCWSKTRPEYVAQCRELYYSGASGKGPELRKLMLRNIEYLREKTQEEETAHHARRTA